MPMNGLYPKKRNLGTNFNQYVVGMQMKLYHLIGFEKENVGMLLFKE